jgi:hypothetical protein
MIKVDKEAAATREPTLRSPEGDVLKSDLVVKNQDWVFLDDISVRHDHGE